MTREEAISRYIVPALKNTWNEKKCGEIIEALEQETILDKTRAEIDIARFIDKDTKVVKNANASGLEVAMQIIDKYKAESGR